MKKLTKIKLINWHYFQNQTIEIKNNCLVTGQNATGKSTILDAIKFVLTAGDQGFNLAAHDHGNRNLIGYVRCKLGSEDKEYLRNGDVTSHVALEFFDDATNKYFVIGVVIDCKENIDGVKYNFYSTDKPLSDNLFIENGIVLSINNFKKTKLIDNIYQTKREAKTAFRILFGSVNERFFSLIQKALAFKPITNVKDFIYQYLLEEKKIDVENIQESIRSYKDLEETLKVIKEKIKELTAIDDIENKLIANLDKSVLLDLLLLLTSIDDTQKQVAKQEVELSKVEALQIEQARKIKDMNEKIDIYDEKSRVLYSQLSTNDTFKAKEELERQVSRLQNDIRITESEVKKFYNHLYNIHNLLDGFKIDSEDRKVYKQIKALDFQTVDSTNIDEVRMKLLSFSKDMDRRVNEIYREQGRLYQERKEKGIEYEYIVKTIKNLESRKLRYNPNVLNLKNEINSRIKKITDMDVSVNILAELLEVTDPEWQSAIENYLNTQRFNLIIDPKFYDFALGVFDEIKNKMPVYGVGLVNTKKIDAFDTCDRNSIASIIKSDNIYAKRYINMVCGNVIMCDSVYDLEKHRVAITKDSMVYSSFTVRQLNDRIEKPFIGRDAAQKQLQKFQEDERLCHLEYLEIDRKIKRYDEELCLINSFDLKGLLEKMSINLTLESQKETLNNLLEKKNRVSSDSIGDVEAEYRNVRDILRRLTQDRLHLYEENGQILERIKSIHEKIDDLNSKIITTQEEFTEKKNKNINLEQAVYETYNQDSKRYRSSSELVSHYQKTVMKNTKDISEIEDELKAKQLAYNNLHSFTSPIGHDFMNNYHDELDKLVRSNLVEYEDKVRKAREDAERIFKEDFLAKLRSYIISAQEGVSKINDALRNVRFGDDKYEFIFPKSKEFANIYEMVMHDDNTSGPIMTPEFEKRYNLELSELFDNLTVNELNSEGAISKYTDYRTYMDYDIKITNRKGETTMFSKVFKEKSGGETQVPFYVSIIASFVQLYSTNKSSIGIIIFDEAFDKMDSDRIRKMMQFVNELDLQLIIAATPQKMESITRYVDTTLIILRDGQRSFVVSKINKDDVVLDNSHDFLM